MRQVSPTWQIKQSGGKVNDLVTMVPWTVEKMGAERSASSSSAEMSTMRVGMYFAPASANLGNLGVAGRTESVLFPVMSFATLLTMRIVVVGSRRYQSFGMCARTFGSFKASQTPLVVGPAKYRYSLRLRPSIRNFFSKGGTTMPLSSREANGACGSGGPGVASAVVASGAGRLGG